MYDLSILRSAERDLAQFDPPVRGRLLKRLDWLAEHAGEVEHEPLKAGLADFYKFRVGDYRVFYRLDHQTRLIVVEAVKHRREAYR